MPGSRRSSAAIPVRRLVGGDPARPRRRTSSSARLLGTAAFIQSTEDHWVNGSGAGSALAFTAILGLVVGAVIVGQTLYAVTRAHMRELATRKALAASGWEIVGFVAWQAGLLAFVGGGIGPLQSLPQPSQPPRAPRISPPTARATPR